MHAQIESFQIRFTKQVVFRDMHGNVLRTFEVGDTCKATGCAETHFITSMGGISFNEAEAVLE